MSNKQNQISNYMSSFAFTVNRDANALDVADKLKRNKFGAALVMDADSLAGIVTERDYLMHLHQLIENPETPVSELMTSDLTCIESTASVCEGKRIMIEKNIRHLPVINQGHVEGILSIKDIFKALDQLLPGPES